MNIGYISLIGPTNAGKSTLLNLVLESKLSIVSSKPQTTRRSVEGIYTSPKGQAVFVDAPGYVMPTTGLNKFLKEEISQRVSASDAVLVCVPGQIHPSDREHLLTELEVLKASGKPYGVVVTKMDQGISEEDMSFLKGLLAPDTKWVQVSSLKEPERSRQEVLDLAFSLLPEGENYLFSPEEWTTMTMREIAREVIREKCFELLDHEVPYGLGVRLSSWQESDEIVKIQADLLVPRDAHKGIVIGKGGKLLKEIGMRARHELEKWVERKVFLGLHVVVRKNWMDQEVHLKELGYVRSK